MGTAYGNECKGGDECHENQHLCKIAGRKDFNFLRELVRESRYLCKKCGRTARSGVNLCRPEEI